MTSDPTAGDILNLVHTVQTRGGVGELSGVRIERVEDGKTATVRRLEEAEEAIERVRALAEKWRYKGEFGWGAWQEGEGPDPEGSALDHAAAEIHAALDGGAEENR